MKKARLEFILNKYFTRIGLPKNIVNLYLSDDSINKEMAITIIEEYADKHYKRKKYAEKQDEQKAKKEKESL